MTSISVDSSVGGLRNALVSNGIHLPSVVVTKVAVAAMQQLSEIVLVWNKRWVEPFWCS